MVSQALVRVSGEVSPVSPELVQVSQVSPELVQVSPVSPAQVSQVSPAPEQVSQVSPAPEQVSQVSPELEQVSQVSPELEQVSQVSQVPALQALAEEWEFLPAQEQQVSAEGSEPLRGGSHWVPLQLLALPG